MIIDTFQSTSFNDNDCINCNSNDIASLIHPPSGSGTVTNLRAEEGSFANSNVVTPVQADSTPRFDSKNSKFPSFIRLLTLGSLF